MTSIDNPQYLVGQREDLEHATLSVYTTPEEQTGALIVPKCVALIKAKESPFASLIKGHFLGGGIRPIDPEGAEDALEYATEEEVASRIRDFLSSYEPIEDPSFDPEFGPKILELISADADQKTVLQTPDDDDNLHTGFYL